MIKKRHHFHIMLVVLMAPWILHGGESSEEAKIPNHLLDCYKHDVIFDEDQAPLRLDVLVGILRKLERVSKLPLSELALAILESFRWDGIKEDTELVPKIATGHHFTKYKLLLDHLVRGDNTHRLELSLTTIEKCLLHKMVSSTMYQPQKEDADEMCEYNDEIEESRRVRANDPGFTRVHRDANKGSQCEIEDGVIQTEWGTIAPGVIIAAVASSLSPSGVLSDEVSQKTSKKKSTKGSAVRNTDDIFDANINKIWLATLAGDLAEMSAFQEVQTGNNMVIGAKGHWNDTLLPRRYVIDMNGPQELYLTDAEILSSIDGIIIATELPKWLTKLGGLKLSQIFEMYYSMYGVAFDSEMKACKRSRNFRNSLKVNDLLKDTSSIAKYLFVKKTGTRAPLDIDENGKRAVYAFEGYWPTLMVKECEETKKDAIPSIELIITTDGTWKNYQVQQFVSHIGKTIDVSHHGSRIGFIENDGNWLFPISENLWDIFKKINIGYKRKRHTDFEKVLQELSKFMNKRFHQKSQDSISYNSVVMFVAPRQRSRKSDLAPILDSIEYMKNTFNVFFIFVTPDPEPFQNLIEEGALVLKVVSPDVVDVLDDVDAALNGHHFSARRTLSLARPNKKKKKKADTNCSETIPVQVNNIVTSGANFNFTLRPVSYFTNIVLEWKSGSRGRVCVRYNTTCYRRCRNFSPQIRRRTYNITNACRIGCCNINVDVRSNYSSFKCDEYSCRRPLTYLLTTIRGYSRGCRSAFDTDECLQKANTMFTTDSTLAESETLDYGLMEMSAVKKERIGKAEKSEANALLVVDSVIVLMYAGLYALCSLDLLTGMQMIACWIALCLYTASCFKTFGLFDEYDH